MATCLASLLGYEAYGIEMEAELVRLSRVLSQSSIFGQNPKIAYENSTTYRLQTLEKATLRRKNR